MSSSSRVEESVLVAVAPGKAFELWTLRINDWWRRGTRYWNDAARAVGLRFEPYKGGRFIEVYDAATGEGFEIGKVTDWAPGRLLAFTWRQADWPESESISMELRFEPEGSSTRVSFRITGWERVTGGVEMSKDYMGGMMELLGWYREHAGTR
jgi:uncharacterized protein YndB with AHSA1/START domain